MPNFSLNWLFNSLIFLLKLNQMLNAIDMKRVDGVFCGSPSTMVPEGQGTCADLLANCYGNLPYLKIFNK